MNPSQIRCRGCNKVFSPRGLSQHLSKDSACHAFRMVSRTPSVFQATPAGSSLGSISNPVPWDRRVVDPRNESSGEWFTSHPYMSFIGHSKVIAILEMACLQPTSHQLAPLLKSLPMPLKVILKTPPKIPLKTPSTPRTPQMPTYWKYCQTTTRPLLTWNRMAVLRHRHLHQRRPSSHHLPHQVTQHSQKLTIRALHLKFLSSASHLVILAPPFLVRIKGLLSTNQVKRASELQLGLLSTPSVTGRLRTGQNCVGPRLRPWKSFLQYHRCVLTDWLLSDF